MLKKILVVLLLVTLTLGVLAGCNKREVDKQTHDMFLEVLPGATEFEDIDISLYQDAINQYDTIHIFEEIKREKNGLGYVMKITLPKVRSIPPTYMEMNFLVGVSIDGKITGIKMLNYSEQFGFDVDLANRFIGFNINELYDTFNYSWLEMNDENETLIYATLEHCVISIDSISVMCIIENKETGLLSEEERMAKMLNKAMPEGENSFTEIKFFGTTELIDRVYEANNGAGYVCLVGDNSYGTFITVDSNGNARGDVSNYYKQCAENAIVYAEVNRLFDIDLSLYSDNELIANKVKYAAKVGCDRYYIEIVGKGYASGLVIGVVITENGIVDNSICVSSNESWGLEKTLGDKFVGKNIDTVVDVEAGVTSLTVNGYRNAVRDALAVFEIINETK